MRSTGNRRRAARFNKDLRSPSADLCRKHGISDATFFNWKPKFGGLAVSEASHLGTWASMAPAGTAIWTAGTVPQSKVDQDSRADQDNVSRPSV